MARVASDNVGLLKVLRKVARLILGEKQESDQPARWLASRL